jgi:hypothetical protein
MFSERAQQCFTFIHAITAAFIRAAKVSLVADSSQELQVLSFTCSAEFVVNNVEQKVLELAGVRFTAF